MKISSNTMIVRKRLDLLTSNIERLGCLMGKVNLVLIRFRFVGDPQGVVSLRFMGFGQSSTTFNTSH